MNYILLCAYNEEKNIVELISNLREILKTFNYKIVVVDDGSQDKTYEKVKSIMGNDIVLIHHYKNLGLGYAMKTGLMYLIPLLSDNDIIITMDADNSHPVEIVPKIINTILEKGYDIVISSRYQTGGRQVSVPLYRRLLSFFARIVFSTLLCYKGVRDYTSGFRGYRSRFIKKLYFVYKDKFIQEKNFVVQIEILTKLFQFSPKIVEIPMVLRYDKKCGRSKLKILRDTLMYIKFIFLYLIDRLKKQGY